MANSIAIIGAGISGLATAWGLRNCPGRVVLFEKGSVIGGNCQSRWLAVDGQYRFCDLGVNDFNTRAYSAVVNAMDEVGIGYSLLEDSACFYRPDGSFAYTLGGLNYHRPMPDALAAQYARFQNEAAQYYLDQPDTDISIGEYLTQVASPPYSHDFGPLCIYARVNAMYFVDPDCPAKDTPFRAVMHYYILQEGFGTPYGPLRMYFHGGAQNWLKRLAQYLNRPIVTNANVRIDSLPQASYTVSYTDSQGALVQEVFDKIVLACHADQIASLFTDQAIIEAVQTDVLQHIRYAPSTAYAHTYTGILPPDVNLWRTYNVTINDQPGIPEQAHPYSMTYLCNKHQNDASSGAYNRYGGPQVLVTLNPCAAVRALLDAEINSGKRDGYMLWDANTHLPIKWDFPHNLMDLAALKAQTRLQPYQGNAGLYFTGGWSHGSGLHEECWLQSQAVAQALTSGLPFAPPSKIGQMPTHLSKALHAR